MAEMPWYEGVDMIRPHIVRISTPRGTGTGFLVSHSKNSSVVGIATAAHVIDHAHYWEEPIRIDHISSGESLLVRHTQRAVFIEAQRDTAAMLFQRSNLPLPTEILQLAPKGAYLRTGADLGWLGFPAISTELCFFGGRISAWLAKDSAYLVDGVAINGVSGGPAFTLHENQPLLIMGVLSAYVPNRATGEVLPGLAVVRDVGQFHDLAPTFASLDQAQEQQTPPVAPSPPPESEKADSVSTRRAT